MTLERFQQLSPATRIALVLIALGLVILLLRLLSGSSFIVLSRFWPLLLVGFGLDLLGRRLVPSLSNGMLSVLLLLALMLLGPAFGLTGRGGAEAMNVPLAGNRSAVIVLDIWAAPTTVSALTGEDDLLRADITDRNRVTLRARGSTEKTVRLGTRWRMFDFGPAGGRWQVGLSPAVPLELNVDSGSGQTTLNLSRLELSEFSLDSGSGNTDITLPASEQPYEATLDSGSGRTKLAIEDGADVTLEADTGSGALEMTFGEDVTASVELDSGSGALNFTLPPNTEARLEVEDGGSGAVTLAPRFSQVEGNNGDDEGVWETPGFAEAARAVTIRLEDRGSGPIQIR